MSDTRKYVQNQVSYLSGSGAVATATSFTLASFKQIDGSTNLTMTDFGTKGFMTLEPNNGTQEESISFTGITQNASGTATITGVSTVLFVDPYTETSGLAKSHPGGSKAVVTNTSAFYAGFTNKGDDETISGKWTFPNDDVSNAGIASDTDTAVATAFVTLGQLSRQAISGASNASTTVKGIVQLPTQAQVLAKTSSGSTGALLALTPDLQASTLLSDYVLATGTANAIAIAPSPSINATGYTVGQTFTFKAILTNTGATTLAVNGLTTKNIFKNGQFALAAGDIKNGAIMMVEYDGTQFQLISKQSKPQVSNTGVEIYGTSTSGTTVYAVALVPAASTYSAGMVVNFKPDTGGGHPTLNINGLGAKNIMKYVGGSLIAVATGDIVASQLATVMYDGTQFQLMNPSSSSTTYISALTSTSSATNQNIDTVFTTTFLPACITLHYIVQGTDTSTNKFSQGVAVYNSAGVLIANNSFYYEKNSSGAVLANDVGVAAIAPAAGAAGGTDKIVATLTVINVSSTGFTVRTAYTGTGGSPAGASIFTAVATK